MAGVAVALSTLALGYDVACARFAPATLRGHTQIKLDVVERGTDHGVADDDFVADALADTDNHGVRTGCCYANGNYSHLMWQGGVKVF